MAISFALLDTTINTTDQTSYVSHSITPSANKLVLVGVAYGRSGATPSTPTVSGNSLTYVEVLTTAGWGTDLAIARKCSVFRALGASPTTGVVTIDFGAETSAGIQIHIVEVTGMDTSGTNGSGAVVQSVDTVLATSATAATSISQALAAYADSNNRGYTFVAHSQNEATTPRANWSELADTTDVTPNMGTETQWSDAAGADATASASWTTTSRAGIIGLEIKIAAAAATEDPFPYVAGGYFPTQG